MYHNFQSFSDINAYHKNSIRLKPNSQTIKPFTFAINDLVHITLHRQQMEMIRRCVPVYRILNRQRTDTPAKEQYRLEREDYPHEISGWIDGRLLEALGVVVCGGSDHMHCPDDPPFRSALEQDGDISLPESVKAGKRHVRRRTRQEER